VHAVLGVFELRETRWLKKNNTANKTKFYTQLIIWQSLKNISKMQQANQNKERLKDYSLASRYLKQFSDDEANQ